MRHAVPVQIVAVAVAVSLLTAPGCATAAEKETSATDVGQTDELDRIRAAVEKALVSDPPRGYAAIPRGVRLLSVRQDATGVIELNVSGELLVSSQRVLEDAVRQILAAAASAREPQPNRIDEFKVLVNGVTLESYLP